VVDRQRSQQQGPGFSDEDRQLPHGTDQQCPDPGRKRQFGQVVDMLAQAVSAQHKAAGPERAVVQAFDRMGVVGGFGQYGERKIVHAVRGSSI